MNYLLELLISLLIDMLARLLAGLQALAMPPLAAVGGGMVPPQYFMAAQNYQNAQCEYLSWRKRVRSHSYRRLAGSLRSWLQGVLRG